MRKTILYGARIQGDLDLGLEPTRTRGTVKDWSRIDTPGGLLPGGSDQDFYEESATQNFRIGTRRVQDERVFRYMKASSNGIARPNWGCQNMNIYKDDNLQDTWEGSMTGTASIGDVTITIADTNTNHGADHFAGGWVTAFYAVNTRIYRIRSSTASDGATVTLTLWDPIREAMSATFMTVHPSIYTKVERVHGGGSTTAATVCVSPIPVTGSYYFWGQTWGPCYCTPSGAAPGTGAYERLLSFNYDGSVVLTPAFAAGSYRQLAGYLLEYTQSGDNFFCLMIAP